MKYDMKNIRLWTSLRLAARELGTDMSGLNSKIGVADGTLELMAEYGIVPEGELLTRLQRLLGLTRGEIVSDLTSPLPLETPRNILVFKNADFEKPYRDLSNVDRQFMIDVPAGDDREYVGMKVQDESMCRAHIHSGDIVVIRRQAVAEDGDVVVAEIGGKTVIRRYHRMADLVWLEAEGYVGNKPDVQSGSLTDRKDRVKIWGKVVACMRSF